MPSVDELLLNGIDTLDGAEAFEETNKYCEIDETGRVIVLNDLAEILGVENDKAVERVYFRCPRYVGDNVDLDITQCTVYINFQNANMDKDQYIVTDLNIDETDSTKVTFSWLLSKKVTQYKGVVNFIVCARKVATGGTIEQEWNTTLAKATVLEGLEPDPYVVPSDDLDVVNQLMDLVKQEIEQKGKETLATIPSDYTTVAQNALSAKNEVEDIRVGADETTYDSAGEAVRGQIGSLSEEIDDIAVKEYVEMQVEFTKGGYIPYFNQHTIVENSSAKYLKISCKSGEKYKIHTKNFYDGRAYALYSGENDMASDYYSGRDSVEVTKEITIPNNVTLLVVNSESSFPAKVEKYVINNKNYYAEKKVMESKLMRNEHAREYFYSSCINLINSENLLPDKGLIYQVGRKYEIIDSPGHYALKSLIPVQEGETYTLLTEYARAVIYNSNLTVIDSKYEGADPVVFTIPTGGAFLSCFWQSAKSITGLYKGNRIGIDFISSNIFIGKTTPINGLNWCAYGDSLTDKNTLKDEEKGTRNYVDFIQWSTGLNVTNLGKGGTGYMADNNYQQSFVDRISQIPTNSNIITCFGSFNDASKAKGHIGTISDNTKDTLYGCLNLFVTGVQSRCPDAIIGLITPTPWSAYNNVNGDSEFAEQYIEAIINIAKKYGTPVLDLYHSSGLRPWNNAFKEKYFRDDTGDGTAEGVHPLQEAHRKYIAPQVENFIRSIANTYISIY